MNMEFRGQSSGIRVSYRAEFLELAGIYCVAQGHSRKMESSAHTPACQLPLSEIIRCQEAYTPASAKLKPLCYLWTCPQAVSFVLQVPRLYLSLTSPIITNHNIYIYFSVINFPKSSNEKQSTALVESATISTIINFWAGSFPKLDVW